MLDHLKGSDTTATIQRESLAPTRHPFRMDSSSNSHCATKGKKKTQRFSHLNEGWDSNMMLVIKQCPDRKRTSVSGYRSIWSQVKSLSDSFCISAISSFNRLVRSQWPCPVKSLAISRLIIHESICVSFIFLNKILKTKFGINWDITELANQGAFSRKCLRIQYAQLNNLRGHLNSFIFVKFILTALLTYKFGCSLSA